MDSTRAGNQARHYGGTSSQTAMRLLVILDVLGTPPSPGSPDTAVSVVASLTRLAKLDFWLRNPDYLADDLLTDFDDGLIARADIEAHITRMLSSGAPSLHRYPMRRYFFGAYDRIDDALAILKSYGQIAHRRNHESGTKSRRDYFLLEAGKESVERMRADIPELHWYDEQAHAISLIADASQGASARRRQYQHPEYEEAEHGLLIPAITERVIARATASNFSITVSPGVDS